MREFPQRPSRLHCAFAFAEREQAEAWHRSAQRPFDVLHEVEAVGAAAAFHAGADAHALGGRESADEIVERARRYWSGEPWRPVEVLIDAPLRVLGVVPDRAGTA